MNQEKQQFNDMEMLLRIDDIIDRLELSIQKSISLTKLQIDVEEAFSETFKLMDKSIKLIEDISDGMIKIIALNNIESAILEFESKLNQI